MAIRATELYICVRFGVLSSISIYADLSDISTPAPAAPPPTKFNLHKHHKRTIKTENICIYIQNRVQTSSVQAYVNRLVHFGMLQFTGLKLLPIIKFSENTHQIASNCISSIFKLVLKFRCKLQNRCLPFHFTFEDKNRAKP